MIGFIFIGALAGIASIAWPIYLHLRQKRRERIQVVPSLKLFVFKQKNVRRLQLENLLLLLCRLLVLMLLFMLVGQPFFQTNRLLPLPLVAGEDARWILGAVIDDSLSAMHHDGARNRLDLEKAWLRRQIEGLSGDTRFVIAPTSYPYPTPELSREEALAYLEEMKPVPAPGNGFEALSGVADRLRGHNACLVVTSALSADTWRPNIEAVGSLPEMPVQVLDAGNVKSAVFILSVERRVNSSGGSDLYVLIQGEPTKMVGRKIDFTMGGRPATHTVTATDALTGRTAIRTGSKTDTEPVEIRLRDEREHPWFRYYLAPAAGAVRRPRVVLIRPATAEARTAEAVMRAALEAAQPDIRMLVVPPGDTRALPGDGPVRAVILGSRPLSPAQLAWLNRQLQQGSSVLCLPLPGQRQAGNPILPGWRPPKRLQAQPPGLDLAEAGTALNQPVEDLILAGLRETRFSEVNEPVFRGGGYPILKTPDGLTVLAARLVHREGLVWGLGWHPSVEEGSAALHPVFPLLVKRLLFPPSAADLLNSNALVGQTLHLAAWFGLKSGQATVQLPDESAVAVDARTEDKLTLDREGFYRMRTPDATVVRAANHPRERSAQLLEPALWQERAPRIKAGWADESTTLTREDFHPVRSGRTLETARRYDLAHFSMLAILVFLVCESILLLRKWRGYLPHAQEGANA